MTENSEGSIVWRLRPIVAADADLILRWRNSDAVRRAMFHDAIISPDEHKAWFQRALTGSAGIHQILEFKGKPVGCNNFTSISAEHSTAFWGCYIGEPTAVPPGAGARLGYLALSHAFEALLLRKLSSEVIAFNGPALSWNRSLGFLEEGLFEDHVARDGRFYDVVRFRMFAAEWPANKRRLQQLLRL